MTGEVDNTEDRLAALRRCRTEDLPKMLELVQTAPHLRKGADMIDKRRRMIDEIQAEIERRLQS